jgi:hypothetical protein
MIPPVVQSARQIDSQVTSNLSEQPEKSSEFFDAASIIKETDQAVKNDAIYRERTVLIKKTTEFFPREIVSEILSYAPTMAGEFISKEYDTSALAQWKQKQKPNVKEFVGLTHEEQSCILNSSKSYRGLVEAINRNKLPLIELDFTFEELKLFLSFNPDLQHVDLRGYNPKLIDDQFFSSFLDSNKNIRELHIPDSSITDQTILKIASLPSLSKLNLTGCNSISLVDEKGNAINLPRSLVSLNLGCCEELEDGGLINLPPYLRQLNLENTFIEGDFKLPETLEWLNLTGSRFVCSDITVFPSTLRWLNLAECEVKGCSEGFKTLSGAKNLGYLNLRSTEISDEAISYIPPSVGKLNISSCFGLTQNMIYTLPQALTKLKIEDIELWDLAIGVLPRSIQKLSINAKNITDSGISNLPPTLTSLALVNCANLTANGFRNLPQTLESLCLEEGDIDDEAIAVLPQGISELNIAGTSITNRGLSLLPPHLRYLNLSQCVSFTNVGLHRLPETLEILDLSECTQISDEGLINLPKGLRKIYIEFLSKVKGTSFKNLPRSITSLSLKHAPILELKHIKDLPPNLQKLNLLGDNITGEIFADLPRTLQSLDLLMVQILSNESLKMLPPNLSSLTLNACLDLPIDGPMHLPSSLENLYIFNCPFNEKFLLEAPFFERLNEVIISNRV